MRRKIMPKEGWKSITVRDSIYDHYYSKYQKHQAELELEGITAFAGYISLLLSKSIGKFAQWLGECAMSVGGVTERYS